MLMLKKEEKHIQKGRNENFSHLASYTVNPAMTFSTLTKPDKNETKRNMKITIV